MGIWWCIQTKTPGDKFLYFRYKTTWQCIELCEEKFISIIIGSQREKKVHTTSWAHTNKKTKNIFVDLSANFRGYNIRTLLK